MPESWIVCANCTCFGVRLPPLLSARSFARISRLLSGVRSSCDMLARNCDFASLAFSAASLARTSSSSRSKSTRSVRTCRPRSASIAARSWLSTAHSIRPVTTTVLTKISRSRRDSLSGRLANGPAWALSVYQSAMPHSSALAAVTSR